MASETYTEFRVVSDEVKRNAEVTEAKNKFYACSEPNGVLAKLVHSMVQRKTFQHMLRGSDRSGYAAYTHILYCTVLYFVLY